MIKGKFIEDMERLQELYESRFVHYSSEYHFKGNEKAEEKMLDYKNCVERMKYIKNYFVHCFCTWKQR